MGGQSPPTATWLNVRGIYSDIFIGIRILYNFSVQNWRRFAGWKRKALLYSRHNNRSVVLLHTGFLCSLYNLQYYWFLCLYNSQCSSLHEHHMQFNYWNHSYAISESNHFLCGAIFRLQPIYLLCFCNDPDLLGIAVCIHNQACGALRQASHRWIECTHT